MDIQTWDHEKAAALGLDYDPCEYWVEKAKRIKADLADRAATLQSYEALKGKLDAMLLKTRHKVMVPCGKLAMMEGTVVNTNDLKAFLGDAWFADRSVAQSKQIIERRLTVVRKNREDLQNDLDDCMRRLHFFDQLGGLDRPAGAASLSTTKTTNMPGIYDDDEPKPSKRVCFGATSTAPAAPPPAAAAPAKSCLRPNERSNELNFINQSEQAAVAEAGSGAAAAAAARSTLARLFPLMEKLPAAAPANDDEPGEAAPADVPASATLTAEQWKRIMADVAAAEAELFAAGASAAPAPAPQEAAAMSAAEVDDALARIAALEAAGEEAPAEAAPATDDAAGDAMTEAELQARMQALGMGGGAGGVVPGAPPRALHDQGIEEEEDSNDYEEVEEEEEEEEVYDAETRSALVAKGMLPREAGGGGVLGKLDMMYSPDAEAPMYTNPADIWAQWEEPAGGDAPAAASLAPAQLQRLAADVEAAEASLAAAPQEPAPPAPAAAPRAPPAAAAVQEKVVVRSGSCVPPPPPPMRKPKARDRTYQ